MTSVVQPQTSSETRLADELNHWASCHDDNIASCGADVTDSPWSDDDEVVRCVVCIEIYNYESPLVECVCPCCVCIGDDGCEVYS